MQTASFRPEEQSHERALRQQNHPSQPGPGLCRSTRELPVFISSSLQHCSSFMIYHVFIQDHKATMRTFATPKLSKLRWRERRVGETKPKHHRDPSWVELERRASSLPGLLEITAGHHCAMRVAIRSQRDQMAPFVYCLRYTAQSDFVRLSFLTL